MNKVLINPENFKGDYIRYLNQCFANWGNEKQYKWAFERIIGKHPSDIIILANEEEEVIAGSGLSFRTVKTKDDKSIEIAIFTGSWTLPNARGRGCFTQIIEVFEQICVEKNIPFLTAFVTESNGSYRRFKELNYYCLEANNILSTEVPFENEEEFKIQFVEKDFATDLFRMYHSDIQNKTAFQYSEEEFSGQFLNRISKIALIKIDDNHFLVEENETTFRLLYMQNFNLKHIKGLSNFILKTKGKKTMFFTTNTNEIDACEKENFKVVKGFFTVKNVTGTQSIVEDIFKNLVINLADKM